MYFTSATTDGPIQFACQTGIYSSKRCSSLSKICEHCWLGLLLDLLIATRGFLIMLYNVLSVAFMSPDGSKSRKRCSKCPEAYHTILSGVPFSKHLPRLADIIGLE